MLFPVRPVVDVSEVPGPTGGAQASLSVLLLLFLGGLGEGAAKLLRGQVRN